MTSGPFAYRCKGDCPVREAKRGRQAPCERITKGPTPSQHRFSRNGHLITFAVFQHSRSNILEEKKSRRRGHWPQQRIKANLRVPPPISESTNHNSGELLIPSEVPLMPRITSTLSSPSSSSSTSPTPSRSSMKSWNPRPTREWTPRSQTTTPPTMSSGSPRKPVGPPSSLKRGRIPTGPP